MNVSVEKKEKNTAVLTVEIPEEKFAESIEKAYQKQKGSIQIPGFRKGKAPRKMIEKMYGVGVFFEEAANIAIRESYDEAAKESGEKIVSRPQFDITQIEPGKSFIYTATVAVKPEVTLGQYKGVEVTKADINVTEAEIDQEIDREREQNAREISVEDRPVQDGDQIKLDFDGSVDGVPFDGGKAENYDLKIGSGSFIPGFEEQIIGKQIGEEFDVNVTFPEDYHAENLKGKAAVFKCKVNGIIERQVPELDEDFVQDVSEFDTVDEYRASVETKIRERKERDAQMQKEREAIKAAVDNAQMELPDQMVEEQAYRAAEDFAQRIQQQGMPMQQYMQLTGMNEAQFVEQMKPQAIEQLKSSLVLEAIAKAENIEITDERLDEEIGKMAEMYSMEKEKLYELMSEEAKAQMKEDLAIQEAAKLVADAAQAVKEKASEQPEEA